jgi:hypothetical protein
MQEFLQNLSCCHFLADEKASCSDCANAAKEVDVEQSADGFEMGRGIFPRTEHKASASGKEQRTGHTEPTRSNGQRTGYVSNGNLFQTDLFKETSSQQEHTGKSTEDINAEISGFFQGFHLPFRSKIITIYYYTTFHDILQPVFPFSLRLFETNGDGGRFEGDFV